MYVETNAGSTDTGSYQVLRLDGSPAIAWHYTPIHLWKTSASVLLALEKPSVVPLVALMKIEDPKATAEKMVEIVHRVENEEERRMLWASTLALMTNKECLEMIQQLIGNDTLLLDTPFLKELREKAETDGYSKGKEDGKVDGYSKGKEDGQVDGYSKGKEDGQVDGYSKGKEDGKVDGYSKGKEDGKDQGLREGLLLSIDLALKNRFGAQGAKIIPEIHSIQDIDIIRAIYLLQLNATSVEDIRSIYLPYLP